MKKMLQLAVFVATLTFLSLVHGQIFVEEMDVRYSSFLDAIGDRPVAFIEEDIQACILQLHTLCSDYAWSEQFNCLCKDIRENGNLIVHADFVKLVQEGLECCDQKMCSKHVCDQEFSYIKAALKDCQDFLCSEQSQLNVQDEMFFKKGRCCSPCFSSCSALTSLFINGVNVLPFLPTGPIIPVTTNRFYAYRQTGVDVNVTTAPLIIPFTGVGQNDGNWTFTGGNAFIALVSGVYLITVSIPYRHDVLVTPQPAIYLFLDPTLDTVVIPTLSVFYYDDLTNSTIASQRTFQLEATFVVSVNAGQVLQFQDRLSATDADFFRVASPTSGSAGAINGSVSIVRIR